MRNIRLFLILSLVLSFTACNRKERVYRTDTTTSGVASVVCDDCFAPIMQEEISVFEALNENAKINPVYTDEVTAMNLLLKDSIRLVLGAKDISDEQIEFLKTKQLYAHSLKVAIDGIALIINKQNKDSLISVSSLKKILSGEINDWKGLNSRSSLGKIRVVFDNPNSSTVRYIEDSICGNKPISGNVKAMKSNLEVIDFVSKTPNAMGVIGVNWVSNRKDSTNLSFISQIRVMSVCPYDDAREDNSYKPFPAYLALKKYPLVRDVFMIISDVRGGLPSGFMSFVAGDRGQRIILKSGLVPSTRPMRLVTVKSEF